MRDYFMSALVIVIWGNVIYEKETTNNKNSQCTIRNPTESPATRSIMRSIINKNSNKNMTRRPKEKMRAQMIDVDYFRKAHVLASCFSA